MTQCKEETQHLLIQNKNSVALIINVTKQGLKFFKWVLRTYRMPSNKLYQNE